jgi:F-type H+-transporting ATPase subunit b
MKFMTSAKTIIATTLWTVVFCFVVATTLLAAQEKPAPAPPQPQQQRQSRDSSRGPGFARQLSHETREAAGEETDDKEEFRNSPSVRFIARVTGLSTGTAYLVSIILNFAVIAGVIFFAARKYLPAAFRARTAAIQKAMQEAQKASEEARRKLADIESRLKKLDAEIGMMREAAERDAAAEESRIRAATVEEGRKLVESAKQEIAAALKAARRELMAYAADLAVGLAAKQIHVDAATDRSLVRNFAGQLAATSGSSADVPGKDGR